MSEGDNKVEWVRGPKTADLRGVDANKLPEAKEARGILVTFDADHPERSQVFKTVVTGMPAPKVQE